MSRLVIESDTHGWFEPDEPVTMDAAAIIRRAFRHVPWPPAQAGSSQFMVMGQPCIVEDRRPPKPTVKRVLLDFDYPFRSERRG